MIQQEDTPLVRESMEYDVVIVGAGPAGLAASIRLKQRNPDLSVVVVEKGADIGSHILSGVVMDPVGLDTLLPDWREDPNRPELVPVVEDRFLYLTSKRAFALPQRMFPPLMSNHGCFVGSLGNIVRYLAGRAEALGVEIYTGFPATHLLFEKRKVAGIITGDMGIGKDGKRKDSFTPGIEIRARWTLLAEGARGSLSKLVVGRFRLDANSDVQKFGTGIKEIWEVPEGRCVPGTITHSVGWPLDRSTGGGSFVYHCGDNRITVGYVVHLDYKNPTLSPFDEFQRFKTHPVMRKLLSGGRRVAYGARALTEGGWQSVPRLTFPGGALIGCAAGFMNVPRIKGSHNAMLSGIQAADAILDDSPDLGAYADGWRDSAIGRDLYPVRNVKPLWSRFGFPFGLALGGLDMWMNSRLRRSPFGTLHHRRPDYASLRQLSDVTPITYPKPDGVLTFDRLSSVFLSGTNHEEDQPCHLLLADPTVPLKENLPLFGEPARLYCPAGVYEVTTEADGNPQFRINAQNCVHCKTCDIKDPAQNITWVPPEGGGGPNYANM